MTGTGKRLDRLYPGLTAKERAILVLRAVKEDHKEDPAIRLTMPSSQGQEFNRLIGLINAADRELAYLVLILRVQVTQLDLKYA